MWPRQEIPVLQKNFEVEVFSCYWLHLCFIKKSYPYVKKIFLNTNIYPGTLKCSNVTKISNKHNWRSEHKFNALEKSPVILFVFQADISLNSSRFQTILLEKSTQALFNRRPWRRWSAFLLNLWTVGFITQSQLKLQLCKLDRFFWDLTSCVATMEPPSGATLGFSNLLIYFLPIGVSFATWQIWQLSTECWPSSNLFFQAQTGSTSLWDSVSQSNPSQHWQSRIIPT